MRSFLLIEKERGYYLVSLKHKMILNISEELFDIISLHELGRKVKAKTAYYSTREKYFTKQLEKYNLLKENRFFEPFPKPQFNTTVTANDLKNKHSEQEVHLLFEPTFLCNLNCTYCCYGKYYSITPRKNKNLDTKVAFKAIDHIINEHTGKAKIFYISFYGGEALLNFEFIRKVVLYCEQHNKINNQSFQYTITTNGVLLDRHLDFLVNHEFDIGISIDGDSYHNSFRVFHNQEEAYQVIIKNINELRSRYPDFYVKNVKFQTVRHNRNRKIDLEKYFQDQFQKSTVISNVSTEGINEKNADEFYRIITDHYIYANNNQHHLIDKYRNYIYSSPFFWIDYLKKSDQRPSNTCLPYQVKYFITSDGELLPCEQIGSEYDFACADRSGIHIDYDKLAKKYTEYFEKLEKSCRSCYHHKDCTECMFTVGVTKNEFKKCSQYLGLKKVKEVFTSIIN